MSEERRAENGLRRGVDWFPSEPAETRDISPADRDCDTAPGTTEVAR